MTQPAALPADVPPRSAPRAAPAVALDPPLARRVLAQAILLGIAADALLRDAITGLAFPLFVALAALAFIALTLHAGRRVGGESAAWLATATLAAATVAWRAEPLLQFAGVLTAAGALLMAAIASYQPDAALLAARLRDLVHAALSRVATAIPGFAPLVLRESIEPHDAAPATRRTGPVLRAALLALALVLVFGALLRGADPIFASLVTLPRVDVGDIVSHVFLAGFFAWLAAGWLRAALDRRERVSPELSLPLQLGALEVTTALGALDVLFASYVLAQLGWFFGGETFLRDRTGLTAAEYARQGFFQVVWVALLVVPLLLATRALLAEDRGLARRHTRLALPLVALVLAIILSAALRMRLYVHYYGLTIERFYALAFLAWLAVLLAWLAFTVLRGRGRRFVAGALVSGLVALLLLDVAAPDIIVARVNIARAATAPESASQRLDVDHLTELGGEAIPLAVDAVLATPRRSRSSAARAAEDHDVCMASTRLAERWGPESSSAAELRDAGAWRRWNAGDAAGLRAVAANIRALRAVQHRACESTWATSRTFARRFHR